MVRLCGTVNCVDTYSVELAVPKWCRNKETDVWSLAYFLNRLIGWLVYWLIDCLIEWVSEWISGWLMVNHCSVSVIIFLPVTKDTPKHAYTLEPTKSEWTDYAAVQTYCGNLSGNELTRSSSGNNTRSQSSQLSEPLWTDPGLNSGISVRELTST